MDCLVFACHHRNISYQMDILLIKGTNPWQRLIINILNASSFHLTLDIDDLLDTLIYSL